MTGGIVSDVFGTFRDSLRLVWSPQSAIDSSVERNMGWVTLCICAALLLAITFAINMTIWWVCDPQFRVDIATIDGLWRQLLLQRLLRPFGLFILIGALFHAAALIFGSQSTQTEYLSAYLLLIGLFAWLTALAAIIVLAGSGTTRAATLLPQVVDFLKTGQGLASLFFGSVVVSLVMSAYAVPVMHWGANLEWPQAAVATVLVLVALTLLQSSPYWYLLAAYQPFAGLSWR